MERLMVESEMVEKAMVERWMVERVTVEKWMVESGVVLISVSLFFNGSICETSASFWPY